MKCPCQNNCCVMALETYVPDRRCTAQNKPGKHLCRVSYLFQDKSHGLTGAPVLSKIHPRPGVIY